MTTNLLAKYGISPEEEAARWDEHRTEQLRAWAIQSFEEKLQSLQDMEETALA